MRTIHKYALHEYTMQTMRLPEGFKFLHADYCRDDLCLWFEVEEDNAKVSRNVAVLETGTETGKLIFEGPFRHVGTVMRGGGISVLHVYLETYDNDNR